MTFWGCLGGGFKKKLPLKIGAPWNELKTLKVEGPFNTFSSPVGPVREIRVDFFSCFLLGGGNSNIFLRIFTPNVWGFMIQFDEHSFQMGGDYPPTRVCP